MDNKELYNMVREHLAGIEKNTEKLANIIESARHTVILGLIGYFAVLILHKIFS